MSIPSKVRFICSKHGEQKFSASLVAGFVLKCGCHWFNGSDGLRFSRNIPYRERWWEQTITERIKYANCAMSNCRRKCVAYQYGDFWCAADLKRVRKLRGQP